MMYKKIIRKLNPRSVVQEQWEENEYFDEAWKERLKGISNYIRDSDKAVCDFGCGPMWLKDYLLPDVQYYGVDYAKRDQSTKVCDLNKGEFPQIHGGVDVSVCSGVIEYIEDVQAFIKKLSGFSRKVVLSYCSLDSFGSLGARKRLAWKNHMHSGQLVALFYANGFKLSAIEYGLETGDIYVFERDEC